MFKILNFFAGFLSKKLIALPFAILLVVALVSYSLWIFSVIYNVYSFIQDIPSLVTSPNVPDPSNILCKFFGLLDCMGFWDGFNAGMLSLVPAITFYVTSVSARLFIGVQQKIVDVVLKITS